MVSGCGGGGGGPGNPYVAPDAPVIRTVQVPFATPVRVGDHVPLVGKGTANPITDIFARDLNGDRVDEVVVGSRISQLAAGDPHRDSLLQIYGWNNDRRNMTNETTTWFRAGENRIVGTEPSIKFGDFNGDGRVDMLVAHSTDNRAVPGQALIYFNQGNNQLVRTTVGLPDMWSHDSVVRDFNGDGIDDFMATDYLGRISVAFGSKSGKFTTHSAAAGVWASSSITAGDFLNDGRMLVVKGDSWTGTNSGSRDVGLYSWTAKDGVLDFTRVAVLPPSRFELPKYAGKIDASTSHEIRTLAMDFNRDGKMDVIVITAAGGGAGSVSEVQFLKNKGQAMFEDVTDSVLVGYNTNSLSSYQPILVDFNGDGLMDVLLGSMDKNSNRVLIQTKEGNFVDSHSDVFRQFVEQAQGMTANVNSWAIPINIINGPDDKKYLITGVNYEEAGEKKQAMYISLIGSTGTATATATIASLKQAWPYLSPAEANRALAATALKGFAGYDPTIHGEGILDWQAAMNPIGGLGLSLDGRTGTRRPITGWISAPGFDSNRLRSVSAVDGLGRDFTVDLSGMNLRLAPVNVAYSEVSGRDRSWSSKFVSRDLVEYQGFHAIGDSQNWSTGSQFPIGRWNSGTVMQISAAQMQGSPWMSMGGVFGRINTSTIMETSLSRTWGDGLWSRVGMMQTVTTITPGLVTTVTPIWSAYMISGWQHASFKMYGGLQPTILAGEIRTRLPDSVDANGVMHYSEGRHRLRNDPVGFVGAEYTWSDRPLKYRVNGVVNQQNQYSVRFSVIQEWK